MADLQKISEIITEHIKTKGDLKADFTITESTQREISMKDGKFTLFRTLFDNDLSIMVIKDHKRGTKYINTFEKEAVEAAIDEALSSAEASDPDECFDIAPGLEPENFSNKALVPDIDKLMERCLELSEDIARDHKKIKVMEMFAKYTRGHSLFINTNGTRDDSEYGFYQIVMEFAGNDGQNSTGINVSWVNFDNLDKKLIELGSIEKDLTDAENSLDPINISNKFEGDVLFTPACAYQVLSYVMGNTVMDNALVNKTSKWLDKIGEQVASPLLTIRANPWDERIICHEVHTLDGFRSENYDVIEKGVLKSFAASLYASNKCGVERARNTGMDAVVDPGDTPYEDMVKGIKKGLIVGSISCGMPGATGELSGVAKNAFYVEDGKIKGAVMETMISTNLFDMLFNIKAISKELLCNGSMVMPYILAGGVTISGN